ncbi:hypothetical protein SAMN05443575_3944 [Jatrophihabitans endophyticus]|uniref:Uncharacterized protein n=1 Tax=Jatrophihabitans endophyticus TaxID=1206085 RepID=A0A1M5T9I8_9ACTN|nr:hypothetical protein [Jatrophihabitans endophyticus]SHH47382.1 hypothetical protein SAMN05443575_3944 [Jatrophihabitans endophyticus]
MNADARAATVEPGSGDAAPELHPALAWTGVALVTASGAAAAWLESLLVPYYVGAALVPVTILLALASNWVLPRLARALVPRTVAAVLPFVAWLAVVFFVAAGGRPEGDVILPGGSAVEYVGYAVMLGGALVGTLSVVTSAPPPQRRPRG